MLTREDQRAELLALIEANHQNLVRLVNEHFDRQQVLGAEISEMTTPKYQPRSALYVLAWNSMRAFLSEKERLPTAFELLDEMSLYDFDHAPLSPQLDTKRKVIRWTDPDTGKQETSFRCFQNALGPMRRALRGDP
jgi:hypothetical protein